MKEISAFVGHSFNPEDEEVVRKFLDYFQQVANSHPHFTWDHAQQAEPRVLAEKVMALLEGKNTFIGICTKRERVLREGALVRPGLFGGLPKVNEQHLIWKASDWVIQEIGLAIGKGLDLVLLIETGVREPGALQGNLEYIQFDRHYPERSFGKLLEMITALSPKTAGSAMTSEPMVATAEAPKIDAKSDGPDPVSPKPDWKRRDYEVAFFRNIVIGNTSGADEIDRAYLSTESAVQEDNGVTWQAFRGYTQIRFGRNGSLSELKALATANPRNSKTLEMLARAYEYFKDFGEAARTYESAARESQEESEEIHLLGSASVAQAKAGESEAALATIDRMRTISDPGGQDELLMLQVLRKIAEWQKIDQDYLAAMERIAEIDPGLTDVLFSLAYKYAETGSNDLALFHYLRIPDAERSASTWNNLGVSFDNRSLPAKSVDAYRRAKEMGETLAMSNMAYKLMGAGFLREAQDECDAALKVPDYHMNIGLAISHLRGLPEEEDTKLEDILKKAKPVSGFYRHLGRASTLPSLTSLPNSWNGPDCVLTVQLNGNIFNAVGTYDQPGGGLANALLGFGASIGSPTPARLSVEYRGVLRGRTIVGQITRTRDGAPIVNSLLNGATNTGRISMVLTDNEDELQVMEAQGNSRRFYSLKRRDNNLQTLASP